MAYGPRNYYDLTRVYPRTFLRSVRRNSRVVFDTAPYTSTGTTRYGVAALSCASTATGTASVLKNGIGVLGSQASINATAAVQRNATATLQASSTVGATAKKYLNAQASINKLYFSDDFSSGSVSSSWTQYGAGNWVVNDGVLQQTSLTPGDPSKLIVTEQTYPADAILTAKVRIDSWTVGDYARAGIGVNTVTATGRGYNLLAHGNLNTLQFLNDGIAWANSYSYNFEIGKWYWFQLTARNGNLYGNVWADGELPPSSDTWMFSQTGWGDFTSLRPALNGGSSGSGGTATSSFDDVTVSSGLSSTMLSRSQITRGASLTLQSESSVQANASVLCLANASVISASTLVGTPVQGVTEDASANLASSSSVSAIGKRIVSGQLNASVSSTTSGKATVQHAASSLVSSQSTQQSQATVRHNAQGSIASSSTQSSIASVSHSGRSALVSASSVAGTAKLTVGASTTVRGESAVAATGRRVLNASTTVRGESAVAATGRRVLNGSLQLGVSATFNVSAYSYSLASCNIVSTSNLNAYGKLIRSGASSLNGTSAVTATAIRIHNSIGTVSVASALTANGEVFVTGTAALVATSMVQPTPGMLLGGTSALQSRSALTSTASLLKQSVSGLASTTTLVATAIQVRLAQCSTSASSALSAVASITRGAESDLAATSTLSGSGLRVVASQAHVVSQATIIASSSSVDQASASLVSASVLAAQATCLTTASSSIGGTGTVVARATAILAARANPVSAATMAGTPAITRRAASILESRSTLTGVSITPLKYATGQTFNSFGFNAITFDGPEVYWVRTSAALASQSTILAKAGHLHSAVAQIVCDSRLETVGEDVRAASAALVSQSTLTASTAQQHLGVADLVSTTSLQAAAETLILRFGSATLASRSSLLAVTQSFFYEVGFGGVLVYGQAVVNTILRTEVGQGGVTVGGVDGVGALVDVIPGYDCYKRELPNHPKPSTADYRPQNVAPLVEFFRPIVSGVLGENIEICQMVFRYENNTPCYREDDIFVQHPTCVPVPYTPEPRPKVKSPELLRYEARAKNSKRLYDYMINSPARIKYFGGNKDNELVPF